jgi:hypothetical protein
MLPFMPFLRLFPLVAKCGPPKVLHALAKHAPFKSVRRFTHNIDTMHGVAMQIWAEKKAALDAGKVTVLEQAGRGKDIMSVLCMSKACILL